MENKLRNAGPRGTINNIVKSWISATELITYIFGIGMDPFRNMSKGRSTE